MALAGSPLQTLLLPGLLPPKDAQTLTYAPRNTALKNGVCTTTSAAGGVWIVRTMSHHRLKTPRVQNEQRISAPTPGKALPRSVISAAFASKWRGALLSASALK